MRVCVFGAGAIGGHVAARLVRGGAEVSVIARGAQLEAIRARGLRIHAPDGSFAARPRAAETAAELGPQDAVVVTVKAPALASVAAGIGPLLGEDTAVAFVMNGIPWWYFDGEGGVRDGQSLPLLDPGDAVRRAVGAGRTLGGVVWSACTVTEPGVIHVETAESRVALGEPDGRAHSPRAEALCALLRAGGMGGEVAPDIRAALWAKLVGNLANGPVTLLTRRGLRDSFADPAVFAATVRATEEGLAIAAALGRPVPGEAEGRVRRAGSIAHKPSILQDFEAGKPLEFDALFTMPLALARAAGVATPTLDMLVGLARQATGFAGTSA